MDLKKMIFSQPKVCNWITEDYEQCLKQRVESNCGYEQDEADQVIAQVFNTKILADMQIDGFR